MKNFKIFVTQCLGFYFKFIFHFVIYIYLYNNPYRRIYAGRK